MPYVALTRAEELLYHHPPEGANDGYRDMNMPIAGNSSLNYRHA